MGRLLWGWGLLCFLVVVFGPDARADDFSFVRVCTRGKGVPPNVDRWSYLPSGKLLLTSNPATFQQKVRGLTIYIYDPNALPSSAEWLPTEYRTACGGNSSLPRKKPADSEDSKEGQPTPTPAASTGAGTIAGSVRPYHEERAGAGGGGCGGDERLV